MANTFDSYYDIQPYRSFRDLDESEGFPGYGLEDEIPDELLDTAAAGDIEEFAPLFEEYPPIV
jgi:hypothetical protein